MQIQQHCTYQLRAMKTTVEAAGYYAPVSAAAAAAAAAAAWTAGLPGLCNDRYCNVTY